MPSVAVVIPWRPDGPERDDGLRHVLRCYANRHPDWDIRIGEPPPGPWRKALAVTAALAGCNADLVVVADADVWTDLRPAVAGVAAGAGWAVPHRLVWRLTEQATRQMLAGQDIQRDTAEAPYTGIVGGGAVVLPRAALDDVPLDPRFAGWGQEDESWGWALTTILGDPLRSDGDLIHLWHPPQQRLTRTRGNPESWRLRRRYARARREPDQMRSLLEEAHAALTAHQPSLHDPAPQHDRREDPVRPAA